MRVFHKQPLIPLVLVYVLIRALSFLTWNHPLTNQVIAALLIGSFAYLCLKKLPLAWVVLIGEILLDGSGHFFELFGFLLRTWFLGIFALTWLTQQFIHVRSESYVLDREHMIPKHTYFEVLVVGVSLIFAFVNGFFHQHTLIYIVQDMLLFLFLLLLFPALDMKHNISAPVQYIVKAYLIGSSLFTLFTFFFYTTSIFSLQDNYYHWFRNVVAGKITDLGNNFFRVVLPEHLYIVPVILIIASFLMRDPKNKKLWFFVLCAGLVFALNFTRIYFVGLVVGFLVLVFKENFKRWFSISALVFLSIFLLFMSVHFVASRGQSFGFELLGLRILGVAAPSADVSGAIRLAILPDAIRQIKENPLLGSGLGATVTYIHPVTKEVETRTQFDWGYLELLTELGILGTLMFLAFLFLILYRLARVTYASSDATVPKNPLLRGLLAGGTALFVINITSPALFHGFGILYFVAIFVTSHVHAKHSSNPHQFHAEVQCAATSDGKHCAPQPSKYRPRLCRGFSRDNKSRRRCA